MKTVHLACVALIAVLGLASGTCLLQAREPRKDAFSSVEPIDMFDAMKEKKLNVRIVPKDATQATVVIENKGKEPLRVRLPAAFVGRPVLAQGRGFDDDGGLGRDGGGGRGRDRGGDGGGGNNSANGANQAFGGGMGGMGMGGMGMGGMGMGGMGMGGMFNVLPDQVRKIKVSTVCLEHGKADPRSTVPYEIVAVEEFTQDSAVAEICGMLGRGEISQSVAQAAAWHRTDGLSWESLATKVKRVSRFRPTQMYFHPQEIVAAAHAERIAETRAAQRVPASTEQTESESSEKSFTSPGEGPVENLLPVPSTRS